MAKVTRENEDADSFFLPNIATWFDVIYDFGLPDYTHIWDDDEGICVRLEHIDFRLIR